MDGMIESKRDASGAIVVVVEIAGIARVKDENVIEMDGGIHGNGSNEAAEACGDPHGLGGVSGVCDARGVWGRDRDRDV